MRAVKKAFGVRTEASPKTPSICLNMIVKNESKVIERCLASVKDRVDYWVIVDTGSTDGTQELIKKAMDGVPGQLHERNWVSFGHNRNEALKLAESYGDFLLFIDADETAMFDEGFAWADMDADCYHIEMRLVNLTYRYPRLVRSACGWRWLGVLHEYLDSDQPFNHGDLTGMRIIARPEGSRSADPLKYQRDAVLLEKALLDEPNNRRYMFYLAQSYRDGGNHERALSCYRKRVEMGGWHEEIFYSKLQIAQLHRRMGADWPVVLDAYLSAHGAAPHRAEPLYEIGQQLLDRQAYHESWLFLQAACERRLPEHDILFVDRPTYIWRAPMALAICAYWVGDHRRAVELNNELLANPELPDSVRQRVIDNRKLSLDLLGIAA